MRQSSMHESDDGSTRLRRTLTKEAWEESTVRWSNNKTDRQDR